MIEEEWLLGMCQFGSRSAECRSRELCFLSVRDFSVPGILNSGHYGWITCQRESSQPQQVAFPARTKHWQKCLLSIDRCINELAEVSLHLA
jgi:hypothetical protein